MRLLMLHGYAQNDEILQAKSRRFIGYMQSAYPHAKFIWANGPVQLHPGDVTENSEDQNENSQEGESAIHVRAWFHQHVPVTSFQEVSDSLAYLVELLQTYGPFDGVVGFSQGSIMAVLLASLLQGDVRRKSYDALPHSLSEKNLPYPLEFSHLAHPPLKFGILFCPGLLRTGTEWLWGGPALSTPFCRFVGEWDTVVSDLQRETALEITATKGSVTVVHQGSHSLPTSDVYAKHLPSFFAGISGLGKEVPCSLVPAGDQKPVLERNDSAYEEWSQRSPSSPKQSSDMVDKLSDTKPVLCLVCMFRQEPDIPIDASALKKLSTSGQILSVDPVAGKVLSTIRDGWQVESGP
jgi:hypothetical protein